MSAVRDSWLVIRFYEIPKSFRAAHSHSGNSSRAMSKPQFFARLSNSISFSCSIFGVRESIQSDERSFPVTIAWSYSGESQMIR